VNGTTRETRGALVDVAASRREGRRTGIYASCWQGGERSEETCQLVGRKRNERLDVVIGGREGREEERGVTASHHMWVHLNNHLESSLVTVKVRVDV
jgi:tRNA 2-selenouridine synthase SelU